MDKEVLVDNNRREDIRWLLSLSESELDLLISLKKLVIRRAKTIGHEALAKKFNLRVLRALGFIVTQYVKKHVKDLSIPVLSESAALLDASNLLNCDLNRGDSKDSDDSELDMLMDKRKRKRVRLNECSNLKRRESTMGVGEISEVLTSEQDS